MLGSGSYLLTIVVVGNIWIISVQKLLIFCQIVNKIGPNQANVKILNKKQNKRGWVGVRYFTFPNNELP